MSVAGGNLYPNWLGSASLTIPNNTITTTVSGITTTVNVVPNVVLNRLSTAALNAGNPQEIIALSNVPVGTYLTGFNCVATAGSSWSGNDILTWLCKVNNSSNNSTRIITRPNNVDDGLSPQSISVAGGGLLYVTTPDSVLEWTSYYTSATPTTGVAGFAWITLQKIAS